MKKDNEFTEVQRFNHPLFIAMMGILTIFILSKWFNLFYGSVAEEDSFTLWLSFWVILSVNLFFFILKLQTRIDSKGITVNYFPFHRKEVLYPWDEIEKVIVKDYKPLAEYGGWGIRTGSSGKAFNTRGNVGISFTLKDGRKRLIGTQTPDAAQDAINALFNNKD
ncbi:MAG: hypothetical protein ACPGD5_03065 [Salibacteraceae bacterium]